jgi:hypothetical protein
MSFPGPFPISSVTPVSSQEMSFRLNERITAQVMQVTGTQVVLDLKGYPVVAQLASKEQAAQLQNQHFANFVITQLTSDKVILKMVPQNETEDSKPVQFEMGNLAENIVKSLDLPGSKAEVALVKSALLNHLPISKEIISQLLETISQSGIELGKGIELAVALKSAGLPVTEASLQLASQFSDTKITETFMNLLSSLKTMLNQANNSPQLRQNLQNTVNQLQTMIPDLSAGEEKIQASLEQFFKFVGKPFEKILDEQVNDLGKAGKGTFSLMNLAQLSKDLKESGNTTASDNVDRFLDQVRQNQFVNIKPETLLGKGQWGEISFFVQWPEGKTYQTADAKVKVSYRQEKRPGVIDPQYTNLILQVDLEPEKDVVFNLSLFQEKVNAEISSTDPEVEDIFKDSLSEFNEMLNQMGYTVVTANVHLKQKTDASQLLSLQFDFLLDGNLNIEV